MNQPLFFNYSNLNNKKKLCATKFMRLHQRAASLITNVTLFLSNWILIGRSQCNKLCKRFNMDKHQGNYERKLVVCYEPYLNETYGSLSHYLISLINRLVLPEGDNIGLSIFLKVKSIAID